jgi:hypothetical protein
MYYHIYMLYYIYTLYIIYYDVPSEHPSRISHEHPHPLRPAAELIRGSSVARPMAMALQPWWPWETNGRPVPLVGSNQFIPMFILFTV